MIQPATAAIQAALAAWSGRTDELVAWANRQVNRRDVFGGYLPIDKRGEKTGPDGSKQNWAGPYTRPSKMNRGTVLLSDAIIRRHFRATKAEEVIGLHTTSPENTSLWGAAEIDWHDENSADPLVISAAALTWFDRLKARGVHPLLTDSNGKGGVHLRVLFRETIPTARLFWFLRDLVSNFADYGLATQPETFPKQSSIKPDGFGTWLRLPGRHHTREHWSRVWSGSEWLDGHDAIDHMVALPFDDPAVIPATIEWDFRVGLYMAKLPTGMCEASGRDDIAFQFLAFMVRDLKMPDPDALSYCGQWDSRNRPPKWAERLRQILSNVHQYGQRAYGHGLTGTNGYAKVPSGSGNPSVSVGGQAEASGEKPFHDTDRGNAERVIDRPGQDIRYAAPMNKS